MPFYHKLGDIPNKRHTVFKSESGEHYYEELFGTIGFVGMSSLVYHSNRPTQVKEVLKKENMQPEVAVKNNIKSRLLKGFDLPKGGGYLESRTPILINKDCHISLAAPNESMTEIFYKNTDADELVFIHKGSGTLKTMLGNLDFSYGDYLLIPRGIIYQIEFNDENNRLFIVESFQPMYTPKRYRNHFGQLLEHSPYCERDLRRPKDLITKNEKGDFLM
ncbi:homogentisate 1,2-dioxygenase, partial [Flavobacteriales bacterium]|nr:homogentisate 1,2-dioxygenase [Flavobacteriales bacterium]